MKTIKKFLKATLVGGLMFLVPVVVVLVVLKHAMSLAAKPARPLAEALPSGVSIGIAGETLIAAVILLLIAFVAGLFARTKPGQSLTGWLEESILGGLPQYRMVKSVAAGLTQIESGEGMVPVLMRTDECWQLGYQIEELPNCWAVVFIPAAPTPMSGNVVYVSLDRIRRLELPMTEAMKLVKRLGIGSTESLRGIDLGPPL